MLIFLLVSVNFLLLLIGSRKDIQSIHYVCTPVVGLACLAELPLWPSCSTELFVFFRWIIIKTTIYKARWCSRSHYKGVCNICVVNC